MGEKLQEWEREKKNTKKKQETKKKNIINTHAQLSRIRMKFGKEKFIE